jgi:prevent-host-death family protein
MRTVTIHSAKTNLSKLIEAALAGEEVVIAKGTKPMVRLVPINQGGFRLGLLEGQLDDGPDFLEPMEDAEVGMWEGGR